MLCLLHIGNAKAGSTALQSSLRSSRSHLQASGVWVSESCSGPDSVNARALAAAFMSADKNDDYTRLHGLAEPSRRNAWRRSVLAGLEREIKAASDAHCECFIITSEHLQTRLSEDLEVSFLAEFLKPHFEEVKVVTYLRRQDQAATSYYGEQIRNGMSPDSILPSPTWARDNMRLLQYEETLSRWANAFGQQAVFPCVYDRNSLTGGDISVDFATKFGLEGLSSTPYLEARKSLSATALLAMRMMNLDAGELSRTSSKIREKRLAFDEYLQKVDSGPAPKASRTDAMAFLAAFESMNTEISSLWTEGRPLFDGDFTDYPELSVNGDIKHAKLLLAEFESEWQKRAES